MKGSGFDVGDLGSFLRLIISLVFGMLIADALTETVISCLLYGAVLVVVYLFMDGVGMYNRTRVVNAGIVTIAILIGAHYIPLLNGLVYWITYIVLYMGVAYVMTFVVTAVYKLLNGEASSEFSIFRRKIV